MSQPGHLPIKDYVALRNSGRKPPAVEGVTTHAQERAKERLGVYLPADTWQAIHRGICEDRWAWVHGTAGSKVYHVPVEARGDKWILPVVVGYGSAIPSITTVLDLVRG